MKNSKTKKLLATITLTSISFNTSFVLAAPGNTKLQPFFLASVYQYLQPEDKQNFWKINKKCTETQLTRNHLNYWCVLSEIFKTNSQAVDASNSFDLEWLAKYYFDNPETIDTASLYNCYHRFVTSLHSSTETYRILDPSTLDTLKKQLEKIDKLLVHCVVGHYIVIPKGNWVSGLQEDYFREYNTYKHFTNSTELFELRKLVIDYCDTTSPRNFFDCIDFTYSNPDRRNEVLQHFIDGKYSTAIDKPENKTGLPTEALAYLNKIARKTHKHYDNSDKSLSYQKLQRIRVDSLPDEHKYNYDTETNTLSVRGLSAGKPLIITATDVQKLLKHLPANIYEKIQNLLTDQPVTTQTTTINLKLENCVVQEYVFSDCNFIDTLTLGKGSRIAPVAFYEITVPTVIVQPGATIEEQGFYDTPIKNLIVQSGARIEPDAFCDAEIKNLEVQQDTTIYPDSFRYAYISKLNVRYGSKVHHDAFSNATIKNLIVQPGTTIPRNTFRNATLKNSATYTNNEPISYDTLTDWGLTDTPSTILDLYLRTISNHDAGPNTLTLDTTDTNRPIVLNKPLLKSITNLTDASSRNNINLVLKNCEVLYDVFNNCDFIDTLTLGNGTTATLHSFARSYIPNLEVQPGAKLEKGSFAWSLLKNLKIREGAKLEPYSFSNTELTNLEVHHDAELAADSFSYAYIKGPATYYAGGDIPKETLNTWGVSRVKPERLLHPGPLTPFGSLLQLEETKTYLNEISDYDESTNTLTLGTNDTNRPNVIDARTGHCIFDTYIDTKNKHINLVLKNCVVKQGAFHCCDFIDTLILGNGTTIERNGFYGAKNIGSAKYGDGSDIPQETLNTWGLIVNLKK